MRRSPVLTGDPPSSDRRGAPSARLLWFNRRGAPMLSQTGLIGAVLLLAAVQHAEGVQVMSPEEQVIPRSIDDEHMMMGSIEDDEHDLGDDTFLSGDLEDESHSGREEVDGGCVEGGLQLLSRGGCVEGAVSRGGCVEGGRLYEISILVGNECCYNSSCSLVRVL